MDSSGGNTNTGFRKPPLLLSIGIQVGKRLGLAPRILRRFLSQVTDEEIKRKAFEGYRPTEKDVFAAVFGKSGTNWMMQIAIQIAHRGHAEFDHIHQLVPWPDAALKLPLELTDPGPSERSPTGLRVIKTHNDAAFIPYDEKATYLTILRDPKEVVVSGYYFICGILDLLSHIDMNTWFESCLQESGGLIEAWSVHADSFWRWKDRPNVLVLSYPEVKAEPRRCIEQVAETMGVQLSGEELDRVIERSRFDYMHRHESKFAPPKPRFSRAKDRPRMVRRGQTGQSEEALSQSQQVAIDQFCLAELERLGSDLPYADLFKVSAGVALKS